MTRDMFKKGARVWIPHSQRIWEGATLVEDHIKGDIVIKLIKDSGETCEIQIKNENDLPLLRNPAILIGQNDLTALSYLNEADVLYNLEVRFADRQSIYTYCGIVLIAINPYADLPLYGSDILRAYRGHTIGELEPHIFAVAEEAYAKLEREKCDISIIISGESGAGKTVSAKHAMRYFAAVGGNDSETQIECKVLASSPIMEAIGNAKTTRNDNSSRFGKFIKLFFTNSTGVMALTGGTMKTYLLEKSRVVFQACGERNYHIFYQLCAARHMWPELKLDHQDKFKYIKHDYSQSHVKVRDLDKFLETTSALTALGLSSQEISDIMTVLAGILHLGNVKFFSKYKKNSGEIDLETCDISINDVDLKIMSDVLQLNASEVHKWLTNRQIESVNESVLIPKNIIAAEEARDALAKHVYSALFQHIVDVVNKNLVSGKKQNCFIGVLDIYGFETFETNSFEQFCINYANEKLQQQFNQHVFKLEQDEYMKEGIAWTMIDFYDNQPCINLIEAKLGILDLLDEECRVPMGSDESWVAKLVEKCSQYKHFERPRFGKTSFVIKHFSDCVQYDARGFLEKNRDTISKDLVNVMKNSKLEICRSLVNAPETSCRPINQTTSLKQHKQSVGSQFRDSLSLLISTLHSTAPHYIRCIKPNEEKAAFKWEPAKIVQQLRACGVLETVRISAAGFPSRCSYSDFYARYRLLYRTDKNSKEDIKSKCKWIVSQWITNDDKYRFGQTQIFFRAGQVAYLEQIRADRRKSYIIKVQSVVRCFIYRTQYRSLIKTALCIQRLGRGWLTRRKALLIRETRASITIQKYFRGYLCRTQFLKLKYLALCIQTYIRGILARRKYKIFVDNFKATQIQKICRAYLARRVYKKKLRQIIVCQSTVRRFLAKQIYKKMKKEARTISHIEKMYKGLEKKIISLQQRYDEINKENLLLTQKISEIPILRRKIEGKRNLENEVKNMKFQLIESENAVLILAEQLENERLEKLDILSKRHSEEKAWRQEKLSWNLENEELKKKYSEILEIVERQQKVVSRTSIFSNDDSEEIHQAYQRVIAEKERIEEENCALKEKITQRTTINFLDCQSDSQSLNSTSVYDVDFGYSSAKNTSELKTYAIKIAGGIMNTMSETMDQYEDTLSFENKSTVLVLKLKNLLVYEKNRNELLSKQLLRLKTSTPNTTEDSLRISDLEVENAKLRHDYTLLRNSIDRGVMQHEIEAQYTALQNELQRRQDECIQLRAALAQQIQSIKTFEAVPVDLSCSEEAIQAFQSQKHVIRQLESELTALTTENNATFTELQKEIEELRSENDCLQTILNEKLDNTEARDVATLRQTNHYLRLELEKSCRNYAQLQEQFNQLTKLNDEVKENVRTLTSKLCDQNEKNSILTKEDQKNIAEVIKKPHVYQGIFKYSPEDVNTILQRLMIELTPRIAVGLLPGLPAYIIFMCIRYTDLLNTEKQVKTLLTSFVRTVKKLYRLPNSIDNRILWLVNTIKLHNLLKQYGGIDEYLKFNTSTQNQQQLKNFDLSEYRQVIYENIINLYRILVLQVQELIKPYVVPAILDHDEMSRGRVMLLNASSDHKPEPKSLVNQLENIYKQLQFFGLDSDYIQQIFKQLVYYISGVSLNSIMLRQEFCMWKTGMKIRYNVGCLEDWARNKKMPNEVLLPIQPLIQVSSLLQSRKSEEDVDSIIELCTSLTAAQVLKIIKSYYPDDCENAITPAFVTKLSQKLNERQTGDPNDKFTTDENYVHSLKVVFQRCDIKLEDIELPPVLKLNGLLEKI